MSRLLRAGSGLGLLALVGCGAQVGPGEEPDPPADVSSEDPATVFDAASPAIVAPTEAVAVHHSDGWIDLAAVDQLLLAVDQDISEARLDDLYQAIAEQGCSVIGALPRSRVLQLGTQPGAELAELAEDLADHDGVLYARPNLVVVVDLAPSPASFSGDEWMADILAEDAWDLGTGDSGIRVATVDGGFDLTMDLLLDDRVERTDSSGGAPGSDDNDLPSKHGTYTTSFAAADGGDTTSDAVGMCWRCSVLSVDVFPALTETFAASAMAGIEVAIGREADIVNISLGPVLAAGVPGTNANFLQLRRLWREGITPAVEAARRAGVMLTFSAGNDGQGVDDNHHPGSPDHVPGVTIYDDDQLLPSGTLLSENAWLSSALIVAASRAGQAFTSIPSADKMGAFSRRGEIVGITAPGQDVGVGDGATTSGTSFSAPLVAGAAGLVASLNQDLNGDEVRQVLVDAANATVLPGISIGAGLLDASAAAQMARASTCAPLLEEIELELASGASTAVDVEYTYPGAGCLDVLLLIDTTASLWDDIDALQAAQETLVEQLAGLSAGVRVGVASFADFPLQSWGSSFYGDQAYVLRQPLTSDTEAVLEAISSLDQPLGNGGDVPESQLEALYQSATGAGRDLDGDSAFDGPGELQPATVGWRSGAVKVIVLATDAPFHDPIEDADYPGASADEAVAALLERGIVVVGLDSGDSGGDVQSIVDQTGGELFALSSSGDGIADAVLDGLDLVTGSVTLTLEAVNDPEGFVTAISPAWVGGVGAGDSHTFEVTFEGVLDAPVAQLVFSNLRLWVRADDGVAARVPVEITVPEP